MDFTTLTPSLCEENFSYALCLPLKGQTLDTDLRVSTCLVINKCKMYVHVRIMRVKNDGEFGGKRYIIMKSLRD